jgi:hypothetical protein
MAIYTMILDYDGGSYISQTDSASEVVAITDWVKRLRSGGIADGVSDDVADAFESAASYGPTPVKGLTNVWCEAASVAEKLALVTIVATAT